MFSSPGPGAPACPVCATRAETQQLAREVRRAVLANGTLCASSSHTARLMGHGRSRPWLDHRAALPGQRRCRPCAVLVASATPSGRRSSTTLRKGMPRRAGSSPRQAELTDRCQSGPNGAATRASAEWALRSGLAAQHPRRPVTFCDGHRCLPRDRQRADPDGRRQFTAPRTRWSSGCTCRHVTGRRARPSGTGSFMR